MASSNTHFEPAKMEQIITEFFAKSLHIILESRCPFVSSRNYSGEQFLSTPSPSSSSSSSSSIKPRDKWFNLALRDCPAAFENIDFWRQSNLEPMIVDVFLVRNRHSYGSDNDEFCEQKNAKIIERWILQYESKRSSGKFKRSTSTSSHILYKKSILLLRSLYSTVRLLPAYKLFRDLISSAQIRMYSLGHQISSFVEPFTRGEEFDMQRFVFTPVETSCGMLCLSVLYKASVFDVGSEPSTPILPQFIPEYVGSPLADPLKRFPSCSTPFGRRHSWSYDLFRVSSPSSTLSKQCSDPFRLTMTPPSPFLLPQSSPHQKSSQALLRFGSAPLSSIPSLQVNQVIPIHQLSLFEQVVPLGLHRPCLTIDKFSTSCKDENEKKAYSKQSLNSLTSNSLAKTSSGLFVDDDYDDYGLSGAFIIDDDDDDGLINPDSSRSSIGTRRHSSDPLPKRTQDAAAVGALIQMLKKAPPLRRDTLTIQSYLQNSHEVSESSATLSSSRTTADALRELGLYSRTKESLLKQGKSSG